MRLALSRISPSRVLIALATINKPTRSPLSAWTLCRSDGLGCPIKPMLTNASPSARLLRCLGSTACPRSTSTRPGSRRSKIFSSAAVPDAYAAARIHAWTVRSCWRRNASFRWSFVSYISMASSPLDFEAGGRRLEATIEQLPCLDDSPRPAISTCRISSAADAIRTARLHHDVRDRNRRREKGARSAAVAPSIARSASASPIAGECLKP